MNRQNNNPNDILQSSAERLAQKHQQRLHQMTREAVYGKAKKQPFQFGMFSKVAVSVFSFALLVFLWQAQPLQNHPPGIENIASSTDVPQWVKDADVPVAVLENLEFYQWLEKELEKNNA